MRISLQCLPVASVPGLASVRERGRPPGRVSMPSYPPPGPVWGVWSSSGALIQELEP